MRKLEVGASVYVGLSDYPLDKNKEYLKMLKDVGVKHVFISAHIPEASESFLSEFMEVVNFASSLGLEMIVDISKPMYEKLKLPKIYALRLDYGFTSEDIKKMYLDNNFILELNASTLKKERLLELESLGIDLKKLRLSHNFYPKVYTGMSRSYVIEKNKMFHEFGMNVSIYIPSHNMHRPPMYEGLPTVEEHRNMDLAAILSEAPLLGADEVIFSDSYASRSELEYAINFDYDYFVIPIKLHNIEKNELELINREHRNRTDATAYFVRSSVRCDSLIEQHDATFRKIGDVTIDNIGMKRYMGEVCVMLKELNEDERVNVVGHAMVDKESLELIKPGQKFKFKIVE